MYIQGVIPSSLYLKISGKICNTRETPSPQFSGNSTMESTLPTFQRGSLSPRPIFTLVREYLVVLQGKTCVSGNPKFAYWTEGNPIPTKYLPQETQLPCRSYWEPADGVSWAGPHCLPGFYLTTGCELLPAIQMEKTFHFLY